MKNIQKYNLLLLLGLIVFGSSVFAAEPTINLKDVEEVNLCVEDLPYRWRSKDYNEGGVYYDTVKTTSTKWDVYTLKLETFEYAIVYKTVDICDECSYIYNGKKYEVPEGQTSAVFKDTTEQVGCDSIFILTLRRASGYHFFDTIHICSGKTYKWQGQTLSQYGDYLKEYTTKVTKLDSVYHLHLVVHDPVDTYEDVTVCESQMPYYWMNNPRTTGGDYTVRLKTQYGCDSVAHLHLTVLPNPEPVYETHFFCQSEGTITHGVKVDKDTTFHDTIPAVNGCDSVRIIHYSPLPISLIEEKIQHFTNETITWREKQFVNDTIYMDTVPEKNQYGCDSIWQLRLVTKYDISRTVTTCEGNTIRHGTIIVKKDTIIDDTLKTKQGADSIIHTTYVFQKPFFNSDTIRICENTQIPWIGHLDPNNPKTTDPVTGEVKPNYIKLWALADGQENKIYDRHKTSGQCDSVYEAVVIGMPAYQHDTVVIWCNDTLDKYGYFEWRGHVISKHDVDTTICDTLNHTHYEVPESEINSSNYWQYLSGGCDSVECLRLIITDRCSPVETKYMCEGGSVIVDGKTYTEPGIYSNPMPSSRNLNLPDSLHRFEVKIAYPQTTQIEEVICESELPYTWYGQHITRAGDYQTTLKTFYGCDSIVKMHLVVVPTVYSPITDWHFCAKEDKILHLPSGRDVSAAAGEGFVFDTIPSPISYIDMHGERQVKMCDSIVRYHIHGHPSYYENDTIVIPQGGHYEWHQNGQLRILTEPSIYWDSCKTVTWGCDSIYRLDLRVAEDWYRKDIVTVCSNELPYKWRGLDCYIAKTYTDRVTGYYNTDSIYELELIINPSYQKDTIPVNICQDTEYKINGKVIPVAAGVRDFFFNDTMKTQFTGCDSIIVYHIRRTPKTVITQEPAYTEEGKPYIWEPIPGHPITCLDAGPYFDTIRSVITGCDSIIYTFDLRYDRQFHDTLRVTRCDSELPYEWRGRLFYNTTVEEENFRTKFLQLDSVYRLELTVNPTFRRDTFVNICQETEYELNGTVIPLTPGTREYIFNDTLKKSDTGCDSIIIYHIIRTPKSIQNEGVHYGIEGEPFTWQPIPGHPITCLTEGSYFDTLRSVISGCDSIVYTFELKYDRPFYDTLRVTRCDSELPYEWRGRSFDKDTVVTDKFPTKFRRLDSIYCLVLSVNPTFKRDTFVHICQDTKYEINGKVIPITTGTGEYLFNDTLKKSDTGCDSIIVYHILRTPKSIEDKGVAYTVQGTPYRWEPIPGKPKYCETLGLHYDTLRSVISGCDSIIYKFELRYDRPFADTLRVTICQSETPYLWREKSFYHSTIDADTFPTKFLHLDSIYRLELTVHPTFKRDTFITICQESEYTINGKTIPVAEGVRDFTFNDTLTTKWTGCDSIIVYHIHRTPIATEDQGVKYIEEGSEFLWEPAPGRSILCKAPGDYYEKVQSVTPPYCDSIIYKIEIRHDRPFHDTLRVNICQSETPYMWRGRPFSHSTIVADTLRTIQMQLDSIYRLELTVRPTYYTYETQYVCKGEGVNFKGDWITEPGLYYDSVLSSQLCDSIHTLNLVRAPSYFFSEIITYIEDNELPLIWTGHYDERGNVRELPGEGIYYDSLRTSHPHSCDSVYQVQVIKKRHYEFEQTASICEGEYYEFFDTKYYESGTYIQPYKTVLGLDSNYILHLTVNPVKITRLEPVYLCPDSTYNFFGEEVSEPGLYTKTLVNPDTYCDSIIEVVVNKYDNSPIVQKHVICEGDNLSIGDERITASGVYYETEMSAGDCFRTIQHFVTVGKPYYREESQVIRRGDTYTWHHCGQPVVLREAGTYYDSCLTMYGCDSVMKLELKFVDPLVYETLYDTICDSDLPYVWQTCRTRNLMETGLYHDTCRSNVADTIRSLHLTVNHVATTRLDPVYLCPDSTYNFFGREISEPGIYTQTLVNPVTKCDSIIEVVVNKFDNTPIVQYDILCEGDILYIGDERITKPGEYLERPTSSDDCFRTIKHIVTIGKPYYLEESQVIRKGDTYTWHQNGQPIVLKEAGVYYDSCLTMYGCDSVIKLKLSFVETQRYETVYDTICYDDLPYIWNTSPVRQIMQEGLYYDTCQGFGVDTIRSLHLTIHQTTRSFETLSLCFGESFKINNRQYTEDAVVRDTLTNSKGCDSIVTYHLKFYPRYEETKTVKLTKAQPFIKIEGADNIIGSDTILRTEGIYYFHYTSIHGCDSLLTLIVDECPHTKVNVIPYNMCKGDVLTVNGERITQSGMYDFFFNSVDGCDSIVRYVVKITPSYEFYEEASVCKNSPYTWRGHHNDTVIYRQGLYYDSLQTTLYGCDSVYVLRLSYIRTDLNDTLVSICKSDLPYKYKGKLYYEDRVFYDTLANNTEGCDSVLRWTFKVNTHCSEYVHYNRCEGHYMTIDGMVISEQGTYAQHHLTEDGQDSLYRFTVHDVPNYEFTTPLTGCDSIVYKGKTYYARGLGNETFTVDLEHRTAEGCDSLEHVQMTIYMSSPTRVYSRTIADFDSVRFGPYFYNTPGSYEMHYTNAKGCDSTEVLNLTVLKTEYKEMKHYTICETDTRGIEVFGKLYHPTEEYTYIADTTWFAGQPIIRTADIIMQRPFTIDRFYPNADQIVCSDYETQFQVSYSTVDPLILPDYYSVDFHADDLEGAPLHQEGELNGKTTFDIFMTGRGKYITPGYYRYSVTFRAESCYMSDTTLEGSLLVRYPDNIMEVSWDDAVMLVNEKYNGGGWVFRPPYKWSVYSAQGLDKTAKVFEDASQPYLYSSNLEEGDRVSVTLYREGYDRPVPSCEFTFVPKNPVLPYGILVYPSAVQSRMPVTIKSPKAGTFRLFDQTGRTYTSGAFQSGETSVLMPATQGCYIMVLEDESGERCTQKMIVY